jgi:OOP family OmpA-OmpF porin
MLLPIPLVSIPGRAWHRGGAQVALFALLGGLATPAHAAPAEAGGGAAASEVYSPRFDFVPGEKVLFFDDFSDTEPGDYPAKWTVCGRREGQLEVVEIQGRRWLKSIKPKTGKDMPMPSTCLRVDPSKKLPAKFTVELDVPASANFVVWFQEAPGVGGYAVEFGPQYVKTRTASDLNLQPPAQATRHVSIAVSGTNVKVYFDGERVLLDPDALPSAAGDKRRLPSTVGLAYRADGVAKGGLSGWGRLRDDLMFTNFKLAEGGKDYTKDLALSGRIVTHGITFDSGSDVIRPESGPTLRKILKLLQDDSALAFEVQGHTDSQGSDQVNGPLSERRAGAVKGWLVSQGIEEGRLTAAGLGASKPLGPNDTPEGRADNRRVEFVKRGG